MIMAGVPVVVLCGGKGVFVDESGVRRSKGLVPVAGEPLVAHVLRHFCRHGARRFILCCGRQHEAYVDLLAALGTRKADAFELSAGGLAGTAVAVDTGADTATGARVRQVEPLLAGSPWFWVTYSDTLSTVDLEALGRFHLEHGRIATCLGARQPTRFRVLGMRRGESVVRGFASQPVLRNDFINGGFYAFRPEVFGPALLGDASQPVLEDAVLERLVQRGELMAYPFDGAWQHFDCERDLGLLERVVAQLSAAG